MSSGAERDSTDSRLKDVYPKVPVGHLLPCLPVFGRLSGKVGESG